MSKYDTQPRKREAKPVPVRDWTTLDHLTHDFSDCPGYRDRCLREHGQYMTHDGRRVAA